ncbi:trypsin-like peptidase domain-containing protein [Leisingera sp. S132]|uniref:trypsin-like peptidase domain-containing protein n=1 Tax=Leisingera sp. S132 TaxID=2867016 RepID=UPI0021A52F44|nr:trypsin-like peptidase domain-containing protein [Leisingera sp. S132]UWQ78424.1 trypsin-like peptidase domain-containing protein [Leisingera sp. S132]
MKKLFAALALPLIALAIAFTAPVSAQSSRDGVWIQIAARPSLREAENEARSYAARLPDVSGYALGGGWYGVVLGPYAREDAERVLQVYRAEGQIPRDSFIAFERNLRSQFYPVAADATQPAQPAPAPAPAEPAVQEPEPQPQTALQTTLPDETPAQARRSESALSREQRMELQVALKAAGFYNSGIDGAFGRGTRASMSDWQAARGFEPTGVLTTAQRQVLMDEFNAPLISVGMARAEDAKAGIALQIPGSEVGFDRYESPFAHYTSKGGLGAQLLLISQPGDKRTLFGLYDILQTLEIVPLDGPRERGADSFTIEGRNASIVSFTQASLKNGEIKGFTLVWPAGDEERRARVLAAMQSSFTRLDGVLDPAEGGDAVQSVDLVSGLEIRKPKLSRSGFFVDGNGSVLTTSDVVAGCTRITLDHGYEATVAANHTADGIAVLTPVQALAPAAVGGLSTASPRLQSEVAVSGFSYEGVLGAPSLTWGKIADVKSLDGNTNVARLELAAQPGDAGGPVLDATGAVLGMLLPQQSGGKQLPEGVSFAVNAEVIRGALNGAGLSPAAQPASGGSLPNAAMTRLASGMTVLVSCWE